MALKTNQKILDTALALFNKLGLSKVTLRTIANEMGISQGNLNYHFKKRDDIVEALYRALVQEVDEAMLVSSGGVEPLQAMFDVIKIMLNGFYTYRFFMLDFMQVLRENPTIKKHYQELAQVREAQVMALIRVMMEQDILRSEQLPNEYKNLYKRVQILADFWLPAAEVSNSKITKKTIDACLELIGQSIYPYLTSKGQEHFRNLK